MSRGLLIGGAYYGLHNVGDEAILLAIVRSFSTLGHIDVLSYGSEWLGEYGFDITVKGAETYSRPKLGIYVAPHRRLTSVIRSLVPDLSVYEGKSLYLCGGGTSLSDCPWYTLRTVLLAERAGVPVVLWGVGMAAVSDSQTLAFIKRVCNSAGVRRVCVRDQFVQERLVRAGVEPSKLQIVYDPAIVLDSREPNLADYLSDAAAALYLNSSMNVCVAISGEEDVVSRTPMVEIREYVRWLANDLGAKVFLIPTGCGDHCSDRALLQSLQVSDSVIYIDREFQPEELIGFLRNTKLMVSSRLHANILAAVAGVPSIGLARNEKLADFASLIGMPCLGLGDLTASILATTTQTLLDDHEDLVRRIRAQVGEMRAVHESAARRIAAEFGE